MKSYPALALIFFIMPFTLAAQAKDSVISSAEWTSILIQAAATKEAKHGDFPTAIQNVAFALAKKASENQRIANPTADRIKMEASSLALKQSEHLKEIPQ